MRITHLIIAIGLLAVLLSGCAPALQQAADTPAQSELETDFELALYQGADCADVITGGVREAGGRMAFTSVLGFRRYTRSVTDKLLMTKTGIFAASGPNRGKRVVLRGNYIHDIVDMGGYGASAYYLDEQAEDCLVEGNLSVRVARPSHNHMARKNTLDVQRGGPPGIPVGRPGNSCRILRRIDGRWHT